ncbi:MAG: sensor domain-containing diguanylate cyclase [Cellvibrionaceae bacterium]|nr:sensor domain-containing diguanylate cyclase [Cellvibrionaceae bacterium]
MALSKRCFRVDPPKSLDIGKWQVTVDLISRIYHTSCGVIVQFKGNEFSTIVTSSNHDNFLSPEDSWSWEIKSFCRRVVETREQLYVNDALAGDEWTDAPPVCQGPVRSYLGFPIFWPDGRVFGTICSIDTKSTNYEISFIELMQQLRDLISGELQHLSDIEQLQKVATTDALTGLYNIRGLSSLGEKRINDQQRFHLDLAVIYLDIDNLKQLNDKYGHEQGDVCIKVFAKSLKLSFRKTDIIARVGGDEFVVLALCNKGSEIELQQSCEDVSQDFSESFASQYSDSINLSVSYGIKIYDTVQSLPLKDMISEADRLMYAHKNRKKLALK